MKWTTVLTVVVAVGMGAGCSSKPAVDEVPVGSDVQLTRRDGALVEGKLTERDATVVKVAAGSATKAVPREEITSFRVKDAKATDLPREARFREITVPDDARVTAKLETTIDTRTATVETPVRAELNEPIIVDGAVAVPAGAELSGVVRSVQSSGKVKGRASLDLVFDKLVVGAKTYPLNARFQRTAASTTKDDIKTIGIPAASGAVIGAIIGGKKGAAIGAAAGGGAGTAVVLSTTGDEIVLEQGTLLALETGRSIVVQVPLK